MSLCDSAGVYYSICPEEIMQYFKAWADPEYRYWFRNSDESLTSALCFARCNADFDSIVQYTSAVIMHHADTAFSIKTTVVDELAYTTFGHDFLWFYEVYDEAPSKQWKHVALDTASIPWDDYIPNVYTQARDSTGDTLTLAEVEASGIFSWQKYLAENNEENEVTFTLNYGLLHTIEQDEYTGLTGDIFWGTMADQATSVRAMMEAEYQGPPDGHNIPLPVDNFPEFICCDYYPFRYVHPDSALAHSGPAEMCDHDWLFLIDHFEEGIDSTVIPALEYDIPVYYYPQTFGVAAGPAMWTSNTLDYRSYLRRNPSSQEFRMLCNLALLHQAKGIFPYNLCSYLEFGSDGSPSSLVSSLLDRHNIPFDAFYEEWVYTGRWPVDEEEDFEYVRPDSIPPWIDGYDPLYEVEEPPDTTGHRDPKNKEIWYEWLFEPYGLLYNDIGGILADVKWIGPEMHDLWWWEENGTAYWDVAQITVPDSDLVDNYVSPLIRIFRKEGSDHTYLFYVNRYCGEYYTGEGDEIPVHISIQGIECPGYLSEDALDHSRRFLIPVNLGLPHALYFFDDTLAAGESRLLEFVNLLPPTQADLRITSPDVFCRPGGCIIRKTELRCNAGDNLELGATFYNMGTSSTGNVTVTFTDHSEASPTVIGTDIISLGGLSQNYQPDSTSAVINWSTNSSDIGAHVIEISAATISGEDPLDNTVKVAVLVEPLDYATEVRGDSWNMTEGGNNDWNTNDIEAVAENWNTSTGWTDSVSGMFEGVINYDSLINWFKGDISLAIPDDPTKYIDTEKYHMLSFGIVGNNPNVIGDIAFTMLIRWKDENDEWGCDWQNILSGSGYHVGNGWDCWSIIGPRDLNDIDNLNWGDYDAKELWFRLQSRSQISPAIPIDIRIGWVRLEESAQ